MNQAQLLNYMKSNNMVAWIGKPDTLEAAKALESRGIVERIGEFEGKPYYRLSRKGEESLGLAPTSSIKMGAIDSKKILGA